MPYYLLLLLRLPLLLSALFPPPSDWVQHRGVSQILWSSGFLVNRVMEWKRLRGSVNCFCKICVWDVVGQQPWLRRDSDASVRMQSCKKYSKTGNSETCKGLSLFNSKSRYSGISQGESVGFSRFLEE